MAFDLFAFTQLREAVQKMMSRFDAGGGTVAQKPNPATLTGIRENLFVFPRKIRRLHGVNSWRPRISVGGGGLVRGWNWLPRLLDVLERCPMEEIFVAVRLRILPAGVKRSRTGRGENGGTTSMPFLRSVGCSWMF